LAVWGLTALFAFGVLAEAGPAVLCIGDDGHADVEYSLARCCLFEADEPERSRPALTGSGRPICDDCVDLGLDDRSLTSGKKLLSLPVATVFGNDLTGGGASSAPTLVSARDVGHEILAAIISSVVLVI
jgi:hypothetical protein